MYYALSVLTGALISVMIVLNGGLSGVYGVFYSTVMIHVVGLIFVILWMLKKRERFAWDKHLPFYYFLGGVIGVCTTAFNNIAFGKISVSAILALCLLGQSAASIAIDQFGLFQMPKVPFNKKKLIGAAFIVLGIVLMTVRS